MPVIPRLLYLGWWDGSDDERRHIGVAGKEGDGKPYN